MKIKEAKDILELIRDNIETPIPEITRTGLAITALTGGIDALESVEALKNKFLKRVRNGSFLFFLISYILYLNIEK